jgi:hypothetical protein
MPATTAKYAYPYPLGTDPVSDGDDAIKALADRVEAVNGPVAVNVAYAASAADNFEGTKVYKSGGLVVCRLAMRCVTAISAGVFFANVPATHRPVGTFRQICWNQAAAGVAVIPVTVNVTGDLYFEVAVPINQVILGHFAWPIP